MSSVKAELSYNPYTLETKAKFNGKEPHINCAIEKYKTKRLQEWINDVPKLFYDEMNGYDFNLEFTGTQLEFDELKQTFLAVTSDVEILHVNKLGSREEKLNDINKLCFWLDNSKNPLFNYNDFIVEHENTFENKCHIYVFESNKDEDVNFGELNVEIEYIDLLGIENEKHLNDLDDGEVEIIPFIIGIDGVEISRIQKLIIMLKNKYANLKDSQLFFKLKNQSNKNGVLRVIKDFGIENPNIINVIHDDAIINFLYVFPISQNRHDVCVEFKNKCNEIQEFLLEEKNKNEIDNSEKYSNIDELSQRIDKLQSAIKNMNNMGTFHISTGFQDKLKNTEKKITGYKKFTNTIVGEENAIKEAELFQQFIFKLLSELYTYMKEQFNILQFQMQMSFRNIYNKSDLLCTDAIVDSKPQTIDYQIPDIKDKLLTCFVEKTLDEKKTFGKKIDNGKKVTIKEHYLSMWRNLVLNEVFDGINNYINQNADLLQEQKVTLIEKYEILIDKHVDELEKERNSVIDSLSEEAKNLERNIFWTDEFAAKIESIERE